MPEVRGHSAEATGNYIILPSRGVRAQRRIEGDFLSQYQGARSTEPMLEISAAAFLAPLSAQPTPVADTAPPQGLGTVRVIDSVHENGPKLVDITDEMASAIRQTHSGVRVLPVRYYQTARSPARSPASSPPRAAIVAPLAIQVRCALTKQPIVGVKVVAMTDLGADEGAAGVTDQSGTVQLALGGDPAQLASLFVDAPPMGHWGFYRTAMNMCSGDTIELETINSAYVDCVRRWCAPFAPTDGVGVKVAIIDTGIGPHPDLQVACGSNTVTGEPRTAFEDNGAGHGTHVAGIIAGQPSVGTPPGIARGAELWSGRVYGKDCDRASNYSIIKAMILAVDAGCDILNLSLTADDADQVLQDGIGDAVHQGAIVFAASGNNGDSKVGFPARCPEAIGVSAFGDTRCYPARVPQESEIGAPAVAPSFFAAFSNYGTGIRFIEPGVGVISTAINSGYAVRSGTSMACAVAAGMAARILAQNPALLTANRDAGRSVALQNLLQSLATSMGFGFQYQGAGKL